MARRPDLKLQLLAGSALGAGLSRDDVRELGACADVIDFPAGALVQHEGAHEPWTYCILGGAALLSSHERPVAVSGPGAWLLGGPDGAPAVTSLAATDLTLLCFRPSDVARALHALPGVLPTSA